MKNIKYPSCSFEGRYTYDVHENCLNFKTYPLFIYQRPKSFHPRDLGRPILNEPPPPSSRPPTLFNTLWNNNRTVHVNEQNQNKTKTKPHHIQIDHTFDLAHKQCSNIIKV